MATERSRDEAMEFLRSSGLPLYELEGWLPIDIACLLDRAKEEAVADERKRLTAWLDAEIEAARRPSDCDNIAAQAARTALERVKARLLG